MPSHQPGRFGGKSPSPRQRSSSHSLQCMVATFGKSIAQAVCCVVRANPVLLLFLPLCVTTPPPPQPPDAAGCPQDCKLPPHTCPPTQSEDCLFMNIFTPHPDALTADEADTGVPVMVFIHGGNFKQV